MTAIMQPLLRALALAPILSTMNHNAVDATMSFMPRRCAVRTLPFANNNKQPSATPFGTRRIFDIRGGNGDYGAPSAPRKEGAWEEEIRKTRDFYNTAPRRLSSASTTNKLIDDENATPSDDDAVEDERVFGNAQSESYNASMQQQSEEDEHTESPQQVQEEVKEAIDSIAYSEQVGIDDSEITTNAPQPVSDEIDGPSSSVQDTATGDQLAEALENNTQDGEISIQQQAKDSISSRDETMNDDDVEEIEVGGEESVSSDEEPPLDESIENDVQLLTKETNDNVEEGVEEVVGTSTNSIDIDAMDSVAKEIIDKPTAAQAVDEVEVEDKVEVLMGNETEKPAAVAPALQEESVDNSDLNNVADGVEGSTASDESGGQSLLAAENEEYRLVEDYLDDGYAGQEVSPISSIDVTEKDLLLPHRFERATPATASNKLVEDGLRRLQRRDGDQPSVPYVITRAMQRVLVDELGYDPLEVKVMRPDVAVVIVAESLERPAELEVLPLRFCNEVEPPPSSDVIIEEVHVEDTSFKGVVAARFHTIQKKVSNSLVSRKPEAMAFILASLGVALSIIFSPSSHGNKRSYDGPSTALSEIPSIIEVDSSMSSEVSGTEEELGKPVEDASSAPELQPDDLDRSWLDRFISFMSKPFGA